MFFSEAILEQRSFPMKASWKVIAINAINYCIFFEKNGNGNFLLVEHFQRWLVISIIFYCSHSGPAQQPIIPIIGRFRETLVKDSLFSRKKSFPDDFVLWQKSQNFALIYWEDRIVVLVTDVFKTHISFSKHFEFEIFPCDPFNCIRNI